MKWSFGVSKTDEQKTFWEVIKAEGWNREWFGLRKFRVANVKDAMIKETGEVAWLIECESNLLEFLHWMVTLGKKRKMIAKGWLSESKNGELKR